MENSYSIKCYAVFLFLKECCTTANIATACNYIEPNYSFGNKNFTDPSADGRFLYKKDFLKENQFDGITGKRPPN